MRERQGFVSFVFRTSEVGAPRSTNDKAAKRRPVIDPGVCHERKNLERAKGLEPSTPTLARSCSTTELHPHPRWRRTRAVNGRRMTNADRECNSPDAIRRHADHPISLIKGSESVRNNAETRFGGPLGPHAGTQGPATQRKCGGDSSYFRANLQTFPVNSPTANRNRRSVGLPGRDIDAPGRFRPRKAPAD